MLRVSIEMEGKEVELAGIALGADAVDASLPAGRELLRFADAIIRGSDQDLTAARRELRAVVGAQGVADAAGVTGFFECVNRVADGAGLPLDDFALASSAEIREELGFNRFSSAAHSLGSDDS